VCTCGSQNKERKVTVLWWFGLLPSALSYDKVNLTTTNVSSGQAVPKLKSKNYGFRMKVGQYPGLFGKPNGFPQAVKTILARSERTVFNERDEAVRYLC
jgi:hypothetical protein